ncbi:MAG TPA: hypothetical protein VHB99_03305, partial [Pirellulales bacterium]|nr:hypothetical protein [Pirellulales bacterium]
FKRRCIDFLRFMYRMSQSTTRANGCPSAELAIRRQIGRPIDSGSGSNEKRRISQDFFLTTDASGD